MKIKYTNKSSIVLVSAMMLALISSSMMAGNTAYDKAFLQQAIARLCVDNSITHTVFKESFPANLTIPVVCDDVQPLTLIGCGTTVDGSSTGNFFDE